MINFIRRMKLKNKIFIFNVINVFIVIMIYSQLLLGYVSNQYTKTFTSNSSEMLVQVANYLDVKLKGILGRINTMMLNNSFDTSMKNFLFNEESYYEAVAMSEFSSLFSELRTSDQFIASIYLYTPKGSFFDLSMPTNHNDFDFLQTNLYKRINAKPLSSIYWGDRGSDEIYLSKKQVIPLVYRFFLDGYNGDILIVINLDEQEMFDYLAGIRSAEGNWMFILDNNGKEVVTNNHSAIGALLKDAAIMNGITSENSGSATLDNDYSKNFIAHQSTRVAPWKIVSIKSDKELQGKLYDMRLYTFSLMAVGVVISLLLGVALSGTLTKPLALLQNTIKKVTNRRFEARFIYPFDDEVGQLGKSFNYMLDEINELVEKLNGTISQLREEKERVRIEQLLKRRAELKALQSQINPHFLYNTLDSINWLAANIEAHDISRMTTSLATLFRNGLNQGSEIISLEDELNHVSSYLAIQKIRYGEKFDYVIHSEESLLQLYTIKLILQPIAENAIYHGIKLKNAPGKIDITAMLVGDAIEVVVMDDGVGMDRLKLNLINNRLKNNIVIGKSGYGIYNVNERIKLYFGEKYGLEYSSEPGHWTKAKILLPIINSEEVETYEQYPCRG